MHEIIEHRLEATGRGPLPNTK